MLLVWKPGDYDNVYFMFVSQLYPHHDLFQIHEWSMIVYSRELSGALRRPVEEPPRLDTNPPDVDDAHTDQHGHIPPEEPDEENVPIDPDDNDMDEYHTMPDPDDDPEDEMIILDDYGPPPDDDVDMPGGIENSGEPDDFGSPPHAPFSNPDVPIEHIETPDDAMIRRQDRTWRNLSAFSGNSGKCQLTQRMLFRRLRPRLSLNDLRYNCLVMRNRFQFRYQKVLMNQTNARS